MKIAYLVLAHRNPKLLGKLVAALSTDDCGFFIHIDQKTDIETFAGIGGPNVFWSERRIPVHWAEFSGVEATLLLLRQALISPEAYDYCVLLQGSDYPLKSGEYIRTFFQVNRGAEFMNMVKIPNDQAGKPISRINKLWITSDRPVRRFAVRALGKVGLAQRDYRKYLGNIQAYGGSACWALSRQACQHIVEFTERNSHVTEYFQRTCAPDEMFFQTIIGNSPFAVQIRRSLHYEDWSGRGNHPAMIDHGHLAVFERSEAVWCEDVYGSAEVLFARKFSDATLEVVARIDEMIRRSESSMPRQTCEADRNG